MSNIDPTTCDHLFETWSPNNIEILQCSKCGQNRTPPETSCDHDWEEIWSAEDHYFTCVNCGAQDPDPALLGPNDPRSKQ